MNNSIQYIFSPSNLCDIMVTKSEHPITTKNTDNICIRISIILSILSPLPTNF